MRQLYAFDFDKTLIPYDSFRKYLFHLCQYMPLYITWNIILRKCHLITTEALKQRIVNTIALKKYLQQQSDIFAEHIAQDIKWPDSINKEAKIIILTASPDCYMKYLSKYLSYDVTIIATGYFQKEFIHIYGENKLNILLKTYPKNQWEYTYAQADNYSDIVWLKQFKSYAIKTL